MKTVIVEVLQKSVFDVELTDEQFEQLVSVDDGSDPFFDSLEAIENILNRDLYEEYGCCSEIWESSWYEK